MAYNLPSIINAFDTPQIVMPFILIHNQSFKPSIPKSQSPSKCNYIEKYN